MSANRAADKGVAPIKLIAPRVPSPDEAKSLAGQFDSLSDPAVRQYLDVALDRLLYTLRLLASLPLDRPRVLEIGARPYLMTVLLKKYLGYELTALNEPPPEGQPPRGVEVLRNLTTGEALEIPFDTANIEVDQLPFPSESFDLVIFCEVIEHLTHDPTWALVEIHRVLKKDGHLVVSTPNALRWEYLRRMLLGRNYYPPFSGYGTTARHNREFSVAELRDLLEGCGFQLQFIEAVRDAAYDHPAWWDKAVSALNRLGFWRQRLDVIHAVAQRGELSRLWYPEYLYYDIQGYRRVVDPFVRMGVNDRLQIDHAGFYPVEDWPPKIRWTKRNAHVFLRGSGQSTLVIRFFNGRRQGHTSGAISADGVRLGVFECEPRTWFETALPLASPASGEVKVSIEVADTWAPDGSSRSRDTRELGVALERVELC